MNKVTSGETGMFLVRTSFVKLPLGQKVQSFTTSTRPCIGPSIFTML